MTYSLAVHGGAGTILRARMTPELEAAYHAGLARALEAGRAVLAAGGPALDAVTASVMALEDEPLFNAGRGAVYNSDGVQEMDACLMDGRDRRVGAVAGIFGPKNPILAARAVMERTSHVLMMADGALKVAREAGLAFADRDYFFTESRWKALQDTLAMRAAQVEDDDPARRHGTVGAVACDSAGNIAAATSTGGMTAKTPGRIGDTPIVGGGTFAENATCAVSGTGHGEVFIRWCAAHEIAARMRHAGQSLTEAADWVVMRDLADHDGSGGLIAVDAAGNVTMPFNCDGMYRGKIVAGGPAQTFIYRD